MLRRKPDPSLQLAEAEHLAWLRLDMLMRR